MKQQGWRLYLKRLLDRTVGLVALVVASPVIAVVAGLIFLVMGPPVLFRQERPGLHGRPFHLLKFRTMVDRRSPDGSLCRDAERLTAFGRLLRATSVDELPQLWNVLKGEMSLVGPRPLLMHYLPLYDAEQTRRHNALPGITGWAQVNGRNAGGWEDNFGL